MGISGFLRFAEGLKTEILIPHLNIKFKVRVHLFLKKKRPAFSKYDLYFNEFGVNFKNMSKTYLGFIVPLF